MLNNKTIMKKHLYKNILSAIATAVFAVPVMAALPTGELTSPLKLMTCDPAVYSPQVMELMRYDSHAAFHPNTGSISPTISLVHYQDKDFDFPISITYNSAGFRPRTADNYVGRDWLLNAGGLIYRRVNGMPDDFKAYKENTDQTYAYTGFLQMLGKNTYNLNTMKQEVAKNPYKYAHLQNAQSSMMTLPGTDGSDRVECSPDVFYFSFGKHSGKFMMNYDGSVSVVGYDGGKYQVDLTGMKLFSNTSPQDTYIRIKTDDGYVYTFGGGGYAPLEYTALSWSDDYNFTPNPSRWRHEITAFHLTQIKAPNGRTLNISYRDVESQYHINPQQNLIPLNQQGRYENLKGLLTQYQLSGKSFISTSYAAGIPRDDAGTSAPAYTQSNASVMYSLNKVALIDRITTDGCTISFTYSTRTQQPLPVTNSSKQFFNSCGAKLDNIQMTYNGSVETAKLTYDYALGKRMFLKSVNTDKEGTFHMEYNTPSLSEVPNPLTCNIDHWGFWRGENSNVALIPGMTYPNLQYSLDYKITTNHRDATGKRYDVSLLRQMTYPTGGRAEFTYEPHRYSTIIQQNGNATFYPSDYSLSPSLSVLAGGARIRSINYKNVAGNTLKETVYTYGSLSREGKVMYMPFYRHLLVEKVVGGNDRVRILGAALNSEGFTDTPFPGVHIRYPEVTEHYLDPSKGGLEQKHPYKIIEFQTGQSLSAVFYRTNDYFQTLIVSGDNHIYTWFEMDYQNQLKHLVAHPTDDVSLYYGKVSREMYYDENKMMRRKADYSYTWQNNDNYSLCLFTPNIGDKQMFNLFTHIGREYFRMLLPSATRTTEYYGTGGTQTREEWESMKYDASGYLKEHASSKNKTDSLITVYRYSEYSGSNCFQMLPTVRQRYLGTSARRQLMESDETTYRLFDNLSGLKWNVVSAQSQFDGSRKLIGKVEYPYYDKYGNPVEAVENNSQHTVFLWSHNGQCRRARIENASYQEVTTALGKKPEDLSASSIGATALSNIRTLLPNARVYSYWTGHGPRITTAGAVNGRDTFYGYGKGGRLGQVYRHDEKGGSELLQVNEYHFVNE